MTTGVEIRGDFHGVTRLQRKLGMSPSWWGLVVGTVGFSGIRVVARLVEMVRQVVWGVFWGVEMAGCR